MNFFLCNLNSTFNTPIKQKKKNQKKKNNKYQGMEFAAAAVIVGSFTTWWYTSETETETPSHSKEDIEMKMFSELRKKVTAIPALELEHSPPQTNKRAVVNVPSERSLTEEERRIKREMGMELMRKLDKRRQSIEQRDDI